MSQFFASGSQSTGVTASESLLPMNIQNCFPLEHLLLELEAPSESLKI